MRISVSRRGSCSGAREGWKLESVLKTPTKAFLERSEKWVEAARQAVGRTEEELAKAEALLEKEEAMASPFAPPSAGLCVAMEISRMQAIIDSLQGELARLRGSSAVVLVQMETN